MRHLKPHASRPKPRVRRGFNLVELLMALAITSALLTAVLVALNASFTAYQMTTEVASTHTVGRLTIHRLLAMVRVGKEFAPTPLDPHDPIVRSDFIDFRYVNDDVDQVITVRWDEDEEDLFVAIDGGEEHLLIENVMPQYYAEDYHIVELRGERIRPFTLEYEKGRHLYRATIDLTIKPDDNMSVDLDGVNEQTIRLVASAMPRMSAY